MRRIVHRSVRVPRAWTRGDRGGSVLAAGHFQQVIAELRLHRALHDIQRRAEHHGVEFLDHLTRTERTQIAALAAGRARGVFLGDLGEVGVELSRLPQLLRFIRRFDRCAVIAGKEWLRKASEVEGALIPGLTIKAFDLHQEAEALAWLEHS